MNDDIQDIKNDLTGLNHGLPNVFENDNAELVTTSGTEDQIITNNSNSDVKAVQGSNNVSDRWIEVINGEFKCNECENVSIPETNTIEGTVNADTEKIKAELMQFPTKVIYATCPVCGMEYIFRVADEKLYLESSDEEK